MVGLMWTWLLVPDTETKAWVIRVVFEDLDILCGWSLGRGSQWDGLLYDHDFVCSTLS